MSDVSGSSANRGVGYPQSTDLRDSSPLFVNNAECADDPTPTNILILVCQNDSQAPVGTLNKSSDQWFVEIKSKIEQKQVELKSHGRLNDTNGSISIKPSYSERFFLAIKSALDSLGNLMGREEQCGLSGFCAASALVRGTIPALKRLGGVEQFSIVGFVFSMAYLLTTSINLGLALRAYARSYETQSQHCAWLLNNLKKAEDFANAADRSTAHAKIFNEFMERVEKVSFLMNIAERKADSAESAFMRESVAMLPGGVVSGVNSFNDLHKIFAQFVGSVLSGISGVFQVAGGVIDLKQACVDKDIARHNIRETKEKILDLKNLNMQINSIIENLKELKNIFKTDLKFSDFRMFKGSMAISAGIAGLVMVGFKIAAVFGVAVLSAAAISLVLMSLSILTGVIMLCFLGAAAYITYNSIKDARKSEEERICAKKYSMDIDRKGDEDSFPDQNLISVRPANKYIELHAIAKACLKEKVPGLSNEDAKTILYNVGMKELHLEALLVEAGSKDEAEKLEWLKSRIGKYLNISYDLRANDITKSVDMAMPQMTLSDEGENILITA